MKTLDRIITVTKSTKVMVKKMLTTLFPEVGYVRVARSGLVIMKKHWYSLRRERVLLTDLVLKTIPEKIAEEAEKRGKGIGYRVIFNSTISAMFQLMNMRQHWNILDYVWEQFNLYCNNIQDIPVREQSALNYTYNNTVLPIISVRSLYGMNKILKIINKTKKEYKNDWLDDIKKHLINLPAKVNHVFLIKRVA